MSVQSIALMPQVAAISTSRWSDAWEWFNGPPFHVILILIFALTSQRIGSHAITKIMNRLGTVQLGSGRIQIASRQVERAKTTDTVLTSTLNTVIFVISLGMILEEFGLNLGPLIASAGVLGLAIGLGAQSSVRDVLAGLFMLIEDQYGVGDLIDVLDISGTVERVGLRITTLRDEAGTLWYLRNGEILKVGNRSQSRN